MLFNSFNFIIFFASSVIIYYALPHRFRWMFLLAASVVFYMAWNPALIALIIFSCAFNHFFSHAISINKTRRVKKRILVFVLFVNFGLLFVFKYLGFINETFMRLFDFIGVAYNIPEFDIILPMGISFYTFQAVGYVIDVYRGELAHEKNFFKFTLFITFFPQLVAGPIERAGALLPQLFERHKFKLQNISDGGKYMLLGFFRKVVIADRAAVIVNAIYGSPRRYGGLSHILATLLFTAQIYCDFCGYSEIALGCAKMLGVDLMKNFKSPYLSKNIREFWSRWHISLSTWFKDYLYFPLGGSRVGPARGYFNLLVTFIVSGVWHGANWTFFIWGAVHGAYQAVGRLTHPAKKRVLRFLRAENFFPVRVFQTIACFLLVSLAWVFFRANNVSDAFYIIASMFRGFEISRAHLFDTLTGLSAGLFDAAALLAMLIILFFIEVFSGETDIHAGLMRRSFAIRFLFYLLIAAFIIAFGVFQNAGQFIYFQF